MPDLLTKRPAVLIRGGLPPPVKRVLGDVWRYGRDRLHYLRGKRILRRYSAHHRAARRLFERDSGVAPPAANGIEELGVVVVRPGEPGHLLTLPDGHLDAVARVARCARERLGEAAHTRDVRSEGALLAVQLVHPLDALPVDALEAIAAPIVSGLQRTLFSSYAIVDRVYVYRTVVTDERARARASWLWHYDNHPRQVVKVLIYLTDVDEDAAPFEYLRRRDVLAAVSGMPITPMHGDSRLTDADVRRLAAAGHEPYRIVGSAGTTIVFDSNVVHRARFARSRCRDVLTLQIRPITFRPDCAIHPRWTGSFRHYDVNERPDDLALREKPDF